MADLAFVRQEFDTALKTSINRAMSFENGERQLLYLFELVVKTFFHTTSDPDSVFDYFEKYFSQHQDSVAMLDFLHHFLTDFTFALRLEDPELPDVVMTHAAKAVSVNIPTAGGTALPEDIVETFSTEDEVLLVLRANRWFYSMLLFRLFGMAQIAAGYTDRQRPSGAK